MRDESPTLILFERVLGADDARPATLSLALDHEQRRRARQRIVLPDGRALGLALPRGTLLKDGDRLLSTASDLVASVRAAAEHVSVVETDDAHLLARCAYHLGNRHVPLCVEPRRLIFPHDHVLDGLVRELGLAVNERILPFEPEAGGYAGEHRHARLAAGARTESHEP